MKHTPLSLKNAIWDIKHKAPASCIGFGKYTECKFDDIMNCLQSQKCKHEYGRKLSHGV